MGVSLAGPGTVRTLGLTGGVGMGKSTAANHLARRGVAVVDTDQIARQVVEPGQPALDEIRGAFGDGVIAPDGTLRRGELARRVFTDTSARVKLEEVLHPRIRAVWKQRLSALREEGHTLAAVVIPLLFETDSQSCFDTTICVACSRPTQLQRLRVRGWTEDQIRQRNAAQLPVERKMELANYVVWTEGDMGVLEEQLDRIIQEPGLEEGSNHNMGVVI